MEHNIPLAVSDHAGPLFRKMFPDSTIAKKYSCARTKTTAVLNGAMAPDMILSLVDLMKAEPFSVNVDGSNDNDLLKMYPLCVRIFDINRGRVCLRFLDMCATSVSTADGIFTKLDETLTKHGLDWSRCVGFSVDNTNVNVGKRNSIMTRVLQINESVYFMGCPCHIIHNCASHSSKAFAKALKFDVGDLAVDVFFWFDYSTKRKNLLAEFCQFCDIEYRKIIKYMSVRWLNLETVVERLLKQYVALKSYFESETESGQSRLARLQSRFSDPMTEVYLMFYQAVLPMFTSVNLMLQRDAPMVYLVRESLFSLLRKTMGKFIRSELLTVEDEKLVLINMSPENQLEANKLFIGFATKQLLTRLAVDTIGQREIGNFYSGVRNFYTTAISYMLKNFPLDHQVLIHASFCNFDSRMTADISSVEFFINRYPAFFTNLNLDDLHDEVVAYKTAPCLPAAVLKSATVTENNSKEEYLRMDVVWDHLSKAKDVSGNLKFPIISKVAILVLTIPHSNADAERVFSIIGKNKIKSRADLAIEGTLASLTTCKVNQFFEIPCYQFKPSKEMLEKAKKATWEYNKTHQT